VRDWSYPYDHEFGEKGGTDYLKKVLQVKDGQHEEIKIVRQHIQGCFDRVFSFLLPHPGLKVATNPSFKGHLSDIDSSFKENLAQLVPLLVSGEGLMVKKINGNPVTGSGLLDCFQVYMKIYQSETLPEPKSMLEATAEANNLNAQNASRDRYIKEMEKLCGAETPYLAPEKLEAKHKELTQLCLEQFKTTRKMGGEAFSAAFEERLQKEMMEAYESFLKRNESKHITNAYRTPAVLVTVMAVSYFISSILDMMGIEFLSQSAIFGLYIPLLCVLLWSYVRYSGNFREVGQAIDNVTAVVWENALQPLYAKLMQKGLQHAVKIGTGKSKTE
jgi:atlastin